MTPSITLESTTIPDTRDAYSRWHTICMLWADSVSYSLTAWVVAARWWFGNNGRAPQYLSEAAQQQYVRAMEYLASGVRTASWNGPCQCTITLSDADWRQAYFAGRCPCCAVEIFRHVTRWASGRCANGLCRMSGWHAEDLPSC